jgi:hypothetical protein
MQCDLEKEEDNFAEKFAARIKCLFQSSTDENDSDVEQANGKLPFRYAVVGVQNAQIQIQTEKTITK